MSGAILSCLQPDRLTTIFWGFLKLLQYWSLEVLDEAEQELNVDRFGHQREVADRESALPVVFAGIAGNGDGRDVREIGKDSQLFEKLIPIDIRHADI